VNRVKFGIDIMLWRRKKEGVEKKRAKLAEGCKPGRLWEKEGSKSTELLGRGMNCETRTTGKKRREVELEKGVENCKGSTMETVQKRLRCEETNAGTVLMRGASCGRFYREGSQFA